MIKKILKYVLPVAILTSGCKDPASFTVNVNEITPIPVVIKAHWRCGSFHNDTFCGTRKVIKYLNKPTSVTLYPLPYYFAVPGMLGLNMFNPKAEAYHPYYLFLNNKRRYPPHYIYQALTKNDASILSQENGVIRFKKNLKVKNLKSLFSGGSPVFLAVILNIHFDSIINYMEYMHELGEPIPSEIMPFVTKLFNIGVEVYDQLDPFYPVGLYEEAGISVKNIYDEKFNFEGKYKTIKSLLKSDEALFKPDIPGSLRKNQEKETAELQFKNEATNGNLIGGLLLGVEAIQRRNYMDAYTWLSKGVAAEHESTKQAFKVLENSFSESGFDFILYQINKSDINSGQQSEWYYLGHKNNYLYLIKKVDDLSGDRAYKINVGKVDINYEQYAFGSGKVKRVKMIKPISSDSFVLDLVPEHTV